MSETNGKHPDCVELSTSGQPIDIPNKFPLPLQNQDSTIEPATLLLMIDRLEKAVKSGISENIKLAAENRQLKKALDDLIKKHGGLK